MMRWLLLLWWLGCAPIGAAADLAPRVEALLAERGLVGASWMLLHGDGTVETGAAGQRAAGVPLRAEDRMHVGSIAKTVLAAGVLRLVSQGRVTLDTPIATLLPELAPANPWHATDPVRLRHLLDHTAGLPDATFRHLFSAAAGPDTPLAAALAAPLPVRTRPGSEFSYSNLGYVLAALAIERVTGQRYERYLDEQLLRPLGMTASTFGHVDQHGATPPLAMGHVDRARPQAYLANFLRPAGQFVTTPADMARFAAFLMGDGRIDGAPFIRADLLRQMGRAQGTAAARAGLPAGYALGLGRRDRHGRVVLCHGGNTVGFRAMFCLAPAQRAAFLVALNMDSEAADYEAFTALMLDALALPRAVAPRATPAGDAQAWQGWYVRLPAKVPAFVYLDLLFNPVALAPAAAGAVELRPLLGAATVLAPAGPRLYRAPDRITATHALLADAGGTAYSDGFGTWRPVSFGRLLWMWASLAAGLGALAWLLVVGTVRLWRTRRGFLADALAPAWAVLLLIPVAGVAVGLAWQTMGDVGAATVALAALTAALPLAALYGLLRLYRGGLRHRRADVLALALLLQWCAVLAAWGLLPFRFWA
ncbi:CubicO group peptidase (beta-lactamase class C family) [Pseudoduganella flava]|uniref:CubicO group peptidase (Beta-lactamase class C family) n=1 Tax=Pseudoduganella flava TaxID=871742 RepID=A0A562PQ03_9BURK|nr:serine hydrolase domain-containing protein [Pseudoduganella flava]QGZ37691.1 serine hydrolase [Pseudoduganella flava]TWI46489.1 CubicO group peptidase (beta-lactamase class C family) [Pseudoduganella flava]